ncbi:MAG: DNA polymerase III subunit beta, partial [Candidatus Omnitrophica bacterium CG12_big_fil_rev_8_21_14_0_65_50_5]
MKINVSKDILLAGIQTVQNIVSSRVTLPILSNILIETTDQTVKLNATDLDIGISCEYPVNVLEKGSITIPAKRFSDVIRELPSGDITIHSRKNNQIDIEGTNYQFRLNGLPADEYPKFPEFDKKDQIDIEQKIFKTMLRLTSFAVSHEESRYVLNGVLMVVVDKTITLVATDGHRLAKIENILKHAPQKDFSVILPVKAVHEINRNLKDEGIVSIVVGRNQVLFNIDGILIATRVIEGEYPNYNQVIPPPVEHKINLNRQEFLSAIRRANLLATPDFQAVKFEVFKKKLVVSKTTPDVGESREEI